jgi:hypothetical protein
MEARKLWAASIHWKEPNAEEIAQLPLSCRVDQGHHVCMLAEGRPLMRGHDFPSDLEHALQVVDPLAGISHLTVASGGRHDGRKGCICREEDGIM